MKKLFLSLITFAVCFSCEAQHSLTVNLDDIKGDTLTIALIDKQLRDYEKQDKVVRSNGVFTYDIDGDKARLCLLVIPSGERKQTLGIYLVPGEHCTITGTTKSYHYSGSAFYQELAALDAKTEPLQKEMAEIMSDYSNRLAQGVNRDTLMKQIMPRYQAVAMKIDEMKMDYIKTNPKSEVCITLLNEVNDRSAAYKYIDESLKSGRFSLFTDAFEAEIAQKKAMEEAKNKLAPGNMAPDFTLNDLNGKPLALSSLRGKYVILDFWGSWCGWCIKGFPEMKKYYEKYSSKLEILGIDCNDKEAAWKAAVEKNQLPWKHVYCPRENSSLLSQYAISGFPTKMIVDAEGKIVKTVVGEDPAFYTFLDELFK